MEHISFERIVNTLSKLKHSQKELLYKILQETLNPIQPEMAISNLNELRENRFNKGQKCLHCGSSWLRKFGKYRNRQRYHCRSCNRTFNDLTATPVHRTQHLDKWDKYLEYMIEGYSIRKCAELLEISKDTSFTWRHKVLHALLLIPTVKLQGIIEADETYELFSAKGCRHLIRKARKRGGVAVKRGISKEQVSILVARDRTKNTSSQLAGMGRIDSQTLQKKIGPQIAPGSILCTDEEPTFRAFCCKAKIAQITINSKAKNRIIDGIYHIQNVNAFHSRYKLWEARFKGIATKYTDNYLVWFNFLDKTSNLERCKRIKQLLFDSTSHTMKICGFNLSKYYQSRFLALCG
jgi:transposase-like protein